MIMGVERNLNKQAGLAVHKDKDHQLRFSVQPYMQALVHILVLAHFCLFKFPSRDVRGNEFDKCVHILIRIHVYYLTMEMSGNSVDLAKGGRKWVFSDKEILFSDKEICVTVKRLELNWNNSTLLLSSGTP